MRNRYEQWGGRGWPQWMSDEFGDGRETGIIWPIVDNETCGVIDGSPTMDQYLCVAFSPEAQKTICDALNAATGKGEDHG